MAKRKQPGKLGNDPFLRGAAARADASTPDKPIRQPAPPPKPPPPPPQPRSSRPGFLGATAGETNSPAKSAVRSLRSESPFTAPKGPKPKPPPLRKTGKAKPDEPASHIQPHAASPHEVPIDGGPHSHGSSPEALPPPSAPRPHWSSPEGLPAGDGPVPHPNSPIGEANASAPRPHPNSPMALDATEWPVPHPNSPLGEPPPSSAPRPHANSPNHVEAEPVAKGPSPSAPEPEITGLSPALDLDAAASRSTPAVPAPIRAGLAAIAKATQVALGLGGGGEVDLWGKDEALAQRLRPVADFLLHTYWRVTVSGAEHLPAGPCVVVANHSGALPLDGAVLAAALHRSRPELPEARWLMEDQIFHAPVVGLLLARLGAVRASPENASRLLAEGRPVLVFPEGVHGLSKPFSERYRLQRFGRGGFVKLAVREGVPIIPAAIVGAEESMPLVGKLPGGFLGLPWLPVTPVPLPAQWHLRFAAPIDLSDAPAEHADEDLAWVQRANDRTRDTVEGLIQAALRERRTVF